MFDNNRWFIMKHLSSDRRLFVRCSMVFECASWEWAMSLDETNACHLFFFVALYSFFRLSCRFHDLYVSKFVCCHFDFASFWLKFFSVMTLHAKKWTFNLVAFVMVCVKAKTFCDFFFSCTIHSILVWHVFLKRFKWLAMPFLIADSIPQKSTMWHKQVKRLDLHNKRWSYDCDCGGLQ